MDEAALCTRVPQVIDALLVQAEKMLLIWSVDEKFDVAANTEKTKQLSQAFGTASGAFGQLTIWRAFRRRSSSRPL